jgi:hypothetical protein
VHEVELEDDTGTDTGVCEMASVIQEGGLEGKARQGPVPAGSQRAGVLLCEVRGISTIGTTKKSQAADLARNVADSSPLSRLDPSKKKWVLHKWPDWDCQIVLDCAAMLASASPYSVAGGG